MPGIYSSNVIAQHHTWPFDEVPLRKFPSTVLARMNDSPFMYLLLMTEIVTCYSLLHKLSDLLEVYAYKSFALE